MRTGRVAAGNFRNDVCTRQLLYVALNRALQDINGSIQGAYIRLEILPNGVREQGSERPTISFIANSIRKEIWTQVSTMMSGCAGQRSVYTLDEITEDVVGEEVLVVLSSCFG